MTANARNLLGRTFTLRIGLSRGNYTYNYTTVTCVDNRTSKVIGRQCGYGYNEVGEGKAQWINAQLHEELSQLAKAAGRRNLAGGKELYGLQADGHILGACDTVELIISHLGLGIRLVRETGQPRTREYKLVYEIVVCPPSYLPPRLFLPR